MSEKINRSEEDMVYDSKIGLPPGTPVHIGEERTHKVVAHIMDYSPDDISESITDTPADCKPPKQDKTRWIHVKGVHNVEFVEELGENFGIHPLVIEDIVRTEQRPKLEIAKENFYLVIRAFYYDKLRHKLSSEQVSIILGHNYVLSFEETTKMIFEPVRKRARKEAGRIRSSGPDYLTYTLIDIIVDEYFAVLEDIGEDIQRLEDTMIFDTSSLTLQKIYQMKRAIMSMRRSVWPLREVISRIMRDEVSLIDSFTEVYIQDSYDHVLRVTDHIETYRDALTDVVDIYLSSTSNRMNEVMKVLTVISTVFIPMTLLASIYGMNFVIPETEWELGYPVILLVMLLSGIIILGYFKRINWL
ncbi:MAG: magnesium/cobalt transporter CorA [Candidatus Lokiarchaeota archaeon]|nr:magnesium/cobalt transporter CorA [Candidatus Lokiarchaeota archaeon]